MTTVNFIYYNHYTISYFNHSDYFAKFSFLNYTLNFENQKIIHIDRVRNNN